MPKKKPPMDPFSGLDWDDLEEWAGSEVVSRGKTYQRQGRVSDLVVTDDGCLIAWVEGTESYATKGTKGGGLPESTCTCHYGFDCKHGVAVVIEYLNRVRDKQTIPRADQNDDRLKLLKDEEGDVEPCDNKVGFPGDTQEDVDNYLKDKTKAQLIDLIHDLALQYPDIAKELSNRQQLKTGHTEKLVSRLREEIESIGNEPDWGDYWDDEGPMADYSRIRSELKALLDAGQAEEVLSLGKDLVATGNRQIEMVDDEGETADEIASCMPVIVQALDQSSLHPADKLTWALDAVLEDQYDICRDFEEYLHRHHPESAWDALSERLLARLKETEGTVAGRDDFAHYYERDLLTNWTVHALACAGRREEVIPLCEQEARSTGSYERLVGLLIQDRRYEDAERWIKEGLWDIGDKWAGNAANLRKKMLEIRMLEKDWRTAAAIQAEEFVRSPSQQTFQDCEKVSRKARTWPSVRKYLLSYLERGDLPWKQQGWPLPESGLEPPLAEGKNRFPMLSPLIDIAILEKTPDRVLHWYNLLPEKRIGWYGVDDDRIAEAVQTHAPDRAVAIWKQKAESLIAYVKPSAYHEAGRYLRKAAKLMQSQNKAGEWETYLSGLRQQHARKPRLLEVLNSLKGKLIVEEGT